LGASTQNHVALAPEPDPDVDLERLSDEELKEFNRLLEEKARGAGSVQ
jgi:hypothetical protein